MWSAWRGHRALALIPIGFVVAVTVFDALNTDNVHYGVLLVLAPLMAALIGDAWFTAATGLLAVCAQVYLAAGLAVQREEAVQILATTVLSTLVVVLTRIRDRRQQQLEQVRSVSEAAQQALMRPLPGRLGELRIASFYLAAADQAEIGGDLYTATRTRHGTRMIIGDVRGKGLTAVGESALLIGAFREVADGHTTLPELAAALDLSVSRYLADFVDDYAHTSEHFITALLLNIPSHGCTVRITSCGHPPPLLIRDGDVRFVASPNPAPPLGMHMLALTDCTEDTAAFEPGDTLLLYTDGVIEARNRVGEFYPLAQRVRHWTGQGPESLLRHLQDDLLQHCGHRLGDDAAAIAIQKSAGPRTSQRAARLREGE